jgi:hypothetical protein
MDLNVELRKAATGLTSGGITGYKETIRNLNTL